MNNGWIKLHKKFIDSPIWKYSVQSHQPHLISLWVYLLLSVNWEEKKWYDGKEEVIVPKGSIITSLSNLSEAVAISMRQVRTALQHYENMRMITKKTTNKWTQVWIVNWAKYQSTDTQDDKPMTNESQTNDKPMTTTKEYKNIRNKEYKREYLSTFPIEDFSDIDATEKQIRLEAEKAMNWLLSKGTTRKDYRAFLRNWVLKVYKKRPEQRPEPVYDYDQNGLAKLRRMKEERLLVKTMN